MLMPHIWKFFRTGGLDQVSLETADDLRSLSELDQKLWVALSCPVQGLELDERTLALIDSDGDGRIRVPELIAAVQWTCARLKDPAIILRGADVLPLDAIKDETPEGRILLLSARQILTNLGKRDAGSLAVPEAADTAKIFSASPLNGDGVIPPEATEDPVVQALIKDIIASVGGSEDRTGSVGVTAEKIDAFFADLSEYATWVAQSATKEIAILGDETAGACAALKAVRAKVDDFFARTRLAAFDQRALGALNRSEEDYLALAAKDMKITAEEVAGFPLARIEVGRSLPLLAAVNPAWAAALGDLHVRVVTPMLGAGKTSLTEQEWQELNTRFAPYEAWLGDKKGSEVEKLGLPRVKEILAGPGRAALAELVAQDKALEPEFQAITDVERLVRYHRDLRCLLHNFVNFADFYSPERLAVFQAGKLYLDSRATELCLRVDGPNPLAAMSKAYIAYCTCTRKDLPTMVVAACFTQGDSDYLFVGRHGVFYDRKGRDWDAVITSISESPISIRQAFWAPYKKFIRMVEEQVAKRAAAADAESSGKLAATAEKTVHADKPAAAAPKKIDVGTVAALGVAFGAIFGALGAIATGLAKLAVWQLPLVVVGLILIISLPSMAIAWLKLRQRTLGPILEGNGWAVNGRVKINIPFGTALTTVAVLPPGSKRSLEDPYEDKEAVRKQRQVTALIFLLVAAGLAWWIREDAKKHPDDAGKAHYFWESGRPAAKAETPPPAPPK